MENGLNLGIIKGKRDERVTNIVPISDLKNDSE